MVYTYKLKQKDQWTWNIKDGAKIKTKISSAGKLGWAVDNCVIRDTFEDAVKYAQMTLENRVCAFGGDHSVKIIRV